MGPGENAGAVDVGDGLVCAFKVESHNHPSAVEPFQGAATGVGGILRDIFAIGARPIAVLDSLRFGEPTSRRARATCSTAPSRGIGHYGNSIGVPTVGGEVYFEAPYEQNCLVNAMALGLARARAARAQRRRRDRQRRRAVRRLHRPRRDRRRLGARLGRARRRRRRQAPDRAGRRSVRGEEAAGVLAGAARARPARLAAGPRRRRPDLLGLGDGLQGRGRDRHRRRARAAARARTWSRSRSWSPSPRSGCCAWSSPRDVPAVLALCEKWEVARRGDRHGHRHAPHARLRRRASSSGTCRSRALVDDCPLYDLAARAARRRRSTPRQPPRSRADASPRETLLALLARPTSPRAGRCSSSTTRSCSRARCAAPSRPTRPCWRCALRERRRAGGDRRARMHRHGSGRDEDRSPRSPSRSTATAAASPPTPTAGTVAAVLECASNLACVGAEPLGTTNNLNFGNPEKPHIAWQLTESVRGLGDACRALRGADRRRQRLALQRGPRPARSTRRP